MERQKTKSLEEVIYILNILKRNKNYVLFGDVEAGDDNC